MIHMSMHLAHGVVPMTTILMKQEVGGNLANNTWTILGHGAGKLTVSQISCL